jgi:hypothetical protein
VDVRECPYYNSIDKKLYLGEIRVRNGLCDMENAESTTYGVNGVLSYMIWFLPVPSVTDEIEYLFFGK